MGSKYTSKHDEAGSPFFETPDYPPPYSQLEVPIPSTSFSAYPSTSHAPRQQNSIVVNINGNGSPVVAHPSNNIGNAILLHNSSKSDRNIFCRHVYSILSVQGLIVCAIISALLYIPHFRTYFEGLNFFKFWTFWGIGTITACFTTTLYKLMRRPPVNLVLLSLVTVSAGVIMGTLAARLGISDSILICVGIVVGVCICVVIFTLQDAYPFTPLNSVIFVWTLNLVAYGILCAATNGNWEDSAYIMIAPLVGTTYFVTTTQLLMKDTRKDINNKEFVFGAVQISMYLVAVFAKILYRIYEKCCPCCACCCDGCGDVCNEL